MADSTDLDALADRVIRLSGPCEESDALIAIAAGWVYHSFRCTNINGSSEVGSLWFPPTFSEEDRLESISEYRQQVANNYWVESLPPAFTGSIDAAMTLMPEGWWLQSLGHCIGGWRCRVETNGPPSYSIGFGFGAGPPAASAALAVAACFIRAKATIARVKEYEA